MKKAFLLIVCVACVLLAACGSGSGSGPKEEKVTVTTGKKEDAKTTLSVGNMGKLEKPDTSHTVEVITGIKETYNGMGKTSVDYPNATEWTAAQTEKDGITFYNGIVTAKTKDGANFMISAWLEGNGDQSYILHYLDCKDGVLFDDGVIED